MRSIILRSFGLVKTAKPSYLRKQRFALTSARKKRSRLLHSSVDFVPTLLFEELAAYYYDCAKGTISGLLRTGNAAPTPAR